MSDHWYLREAEPLTVWRRARVAVSDGRGVGLVWFGNGGELELVDAGGALRGFTYGMFPGVSSLDYLRTLVEHGGYELVGEDGRPCPVSVLEGLARRGREGGAGCLG